MDGWQDAGGWLRVALLVHAHLLLVDAQAVRVLAIFGTVWVVNVDVGAVEVDRVDTDVYLTVTCSEVCIFTIPVEEEVLN